MQNNLHTSGTSLKCQNVQLYRIASLEKGIFFAAYMKVLQSAANQNQPHSFKDVYVPVFFFMARFSFCLFFFCLVSI